MGDFKCVVLVILCLMALAHPRISTDAKPDYTFTYAKAKSEAGVLTVEDSKTATAAPGGASGGISTAAAGGGSDEKSTAAPGWGSSVATSVAPSTGSGGISTAAAGGDEKLHKCARHTEEEMEKKPHGCGCSG